jgi:hypothetical protein
MVLRVSVLDGRAQWQLAGKWRHLSSAVGGAGGGQAPVVLFRAGQNRYTGAVPARLEFPPFTCSYLFEESSWPNPH